MKNYGKSITKRVISTLIAFALVFGIFPTYVIAENLKVETPTYTEADNPGDIFTGVSTSVQLDCATEGAGIYYTKDGNDPVANADGTYSYTIDPNNYIEITETTTIKAIAVKDGMDNSDVLTFTLTKTDRTAAVTFEPEFELFSDTLDITLSSETDGATIYYTTDENAEKSEFTKYTEVFEITDTTTVRAYATKDGLVDALIETKYYTKIDTPTFDANSTYTVNGTIFEENFTGDYWESNFDGFYEDVFTITTDENSDPTMTINLISQKSYGDSKSSYINAMTVSNTSGGNNIVTDSDFATTAPEYGFVDTGYVSFPLTNIAIDGKYYGTATRSNGSGAENIDITVDWSSQVKVQPQVETPVFSPADGIVFDGSGEVTITCATEGASIYYTTDGTTPSASSTPYTSAITLDKTTTITAIAIKDGMDDSELKSVEFIVKSAPEFESNKRYEVEIAMSEKDGTAGYGDAFYSYYTDKAIITTDDSKNPTMEIEFIYRGTYEGKLTDISIYDATTGTNETTVTYTDNPPNGDDYTITGELTGTASFVLPYLDANGIYYGKGTINALPSYSATEKTDAVHDVELTVDWGTIKEVLDPVSAPVFSQPNGHTFEDSGSVTISSDTADAKIYYATGVGYVSDPTTSSTLYDGTEIMFTEDIIIKAIAVKDGMADSEVVEVNYYVKSMPTLENNSAYTVDISLIKKGAGEWDYTYSNYYSDEATIVTDDAGNEKITVDLTYYNSSYLGNGKISGMSIYDSTSGTTAVSDLVYNDKNIANPESSDVIATTEFTLPYVDVSGKYYGTATIDGTVSDAGTGDIELIIDWATLEKTGDVDPTDPPKPSETRNFRIPIYMDSEGDGNLFESESFGYVTPMYGGEPSLTLDDETYNIEILLQSRYGENFQAIYFTEFKIYTDSARTNEVSNYEYTEYDPMEFFGHPVSFDLTDGLTDTYYIQAKFSDDADTVVNGTLTLNWDKLNEILPKADKVVISPNGGTINSDTKITLTAENGADIYYMLGGYANTPFDYDDTLKDEAILYTAPFSITESTSFHTQAIVDGKDPSEVNSVNFTIDAGVQNLGTIISIKHTSNELYESLMLYTSDETYKTLLEVRAGMPTVSEYYVLVEQGEKSERHLYNGGIGGFIPVQNSDNYSLNLLLAKDKWDLTLPMTVTIIAPEYQSKELDITLDSQTINSQNDVNPSEDSVKIDRNSIETGKTYTAEFTAIKTGTQDESMLAGFFEPTAKIEVQDDNTVDITFRNMVMPGQLQDFALKGSGEWTSAVKDGDRTENADEAYFTIPVSLEDFKSGEFLGGVNVIAMGGSLADNGSYEKYTSVEITFSSELIEGFVGFESTQNGLTEEKSLNRLLIAASNVDVNGNFDTNNDGYVSNDEISSYQETELNLEVGEVQTNAYSSFDDIEIKDISFMQLLPKTVEKIDLSGHNITAIGDEFKGFTELVRLDLSANAIIGIADNAFSDLGKLETLLLSSNAITEVTADMFKGLTSLGKGSNTESSFSLSQNNIQTIEAGAFSDLDNIKGIYLIDNLLETVNDGTFTGMNLLETINISNNNLSKIPNDIKNIEILKEVNLSDNNIEEITDALKGDALLTINLSNNIIGSVPENLLTNVPNAQKIMLESNNITTMTADYARKALAHDNFGDVFVKNPIDVNSIAGLTQDEINEISVILGENGVTSAILNLELTAHNDKISYTQDLSIFDLYFWNLAIEEPEELQKVLGKETIDSVSDYKTFRQANLPSFDAEDFDNSILGDKNSYVRDYEIEITIEKLIGDNWVELSNEVLYGGEDAKIGEIVDTNMSNGNKYRIIKTIDTYSSVAYATATISNDNTPPAEDSITNGTYSVPLTVKQYGNQSEDSMANGAIVGTAKAVVNDDSVTYTITFQGMELQNLYGHLTDFWFYTYEDSSDGTLTDAQYPDNITYYDDENMDGDIAKFPATVTFTYYGEPEHDVNVLVEVDAMSEIGEGRQPAVLVFDWNNAKKDGGASSGGSSGGVSGSTDTDEDNAFESGDDITHSDISDLIQDKNELIVKNDDGISATFDVNSLEEISKVAGESSVEITIETVEIDDLTDEQKEIVSDRPVFDFKVLVGNKEITDFENGKVRISIPYELKAGENPDGLIIWYVADDGTVEKIYCTYDKENEEVSFETNHFSVYVIAYDEANIWENAFNDVDTDDWYYDAVRYVVLNNLFNGTSENTFSSNEEMTRAMLWTVLARSQNVETDGGELWYSKGLEWAIANEVSYGTEPNGNITREQIATMLYRFEKAETVNADLSKFTDSEDISDWAIDAMNWAVSEGLITGITDETLNPKGNATRAQVATILMRYLEN